MSERSVMFDRLRASASSLNAAGDAARAAIVEFESELVATGCGVECWLSVVDFNCSVVELGFARCGESWRVAVRRIAGADLRPVGEPRPLVDVERLLRVQLASRLDELLALIVERAESMVWELRSDSLV